MLVHPTIGSTRMLPVLLFASFLLQLPPASGSTHTTATAQSNESVQRPNYQNVLPKLLSQTRIPILLPNAIYSEMPLYGDVDTAAATDYRISLDFEPDCHGSAVCTLGRMSGLTRKFGVRRPSGKVVSLVNGIKGYFLATDPEENCNVGYCFASLTWDMGKNRYKLKLKLEKVDAFIKAANSAIVGSRRLTHLLHHSQGFSTR